jgi:hypothetical protein
MQKLIQWFLAILAVVIFFAALFVGHAQAGHGLYPWPACCSDRDCFPVPPGFLRWTPDGNGKGDAGYIVTDTGQFFPELDANGSPNWRIKKSKDMQNHICRLRGNDNFGANIASQPPRTLCVIVAPSGN